MTKNIYIVQYDKTSIEYGMTLTGIRQAIEEAPTAYDVDNVLRSLKHREDQYQAKLDEQRGSCMVIGYLEDIKAYVDAQDIVREGGFEFEV